MYMCMYMYMYVTNGAVSCLLQQFRHYLYIAKHICDVKVHLIHNDATDWITNVYTLCPYLTSLHSCYLNAPPYTPSIHKADTLCVAAVWCGGGRWRRGTGL